MAYGILNADVIGTSVVGSNLGAGNATLMKNRLIDAGFTINQRGYVSGTALSSGTYAHDRWKAGSGGCTYTFTQLSTGVPIVITITAGSLQQVIEGANIPDGGTFTLSWTGTAQARFNGGTYGSSPLAVTGLTAGSNCTIEFNTGTCSFPQLEVGSSATGFEYRQYQQELALCQRYYYKALAGGSVSTFGAGVALTTTNAVGVTMFPVTMRTSPTALEQSGTATDYRIYGTAGGTTCNAVPIIAANTGSPFSVSTSFTVASGLTAGQGQYIQSATTNGYLAWSAEL